MRKFLRSEFTDRCARAGIWRARSPISAPAVRCSFSPRTTALVRAFPNVMGFYFEDHQSMYAHAGLQVDKTLDAIVHRHRGQHPAHGPTFRAFQRRGILRGKDYRYHADFNTEFPAAPDGSFVYVWARMWSEGESAIKFDVSCRCPTV